MALPYMEKHRGFPGRLPGTDFQFVLRRANKDGATKLTERIRYPDRRLLTSAPMLASCWHFGITSATNRSCAAIWMPGASAGCSGARSCPPKTLSIRPATRPFCRSMSPLRKAVFQRFSRNEPGSPIIWSTRQLSAGNRRGNLSCGKRICGTPEIPHVCR